MTIVNIVQVTAHRWQIESQKGIVMKKDITAHSTYEASEYCRKWISSFQAWDFRVVPLEVK